MLIHTRNLIAIIFISTMMTACSNSPKIISASDDQIILKAKPESFLDAYDIAKRECDKNTRIAQYITDGTESLNEVAFSCFDPNAEAEVIAEADVDTTAEEAEEGAFEEDFVESTEAMTEEIPTEEDIQ